MAFLMQILFKFQSYAAPTRHLIPVPGLIQAVTLHDATAGVFKIATSAIIRTNLFLRPKHTLTPFF